MGQINSLCREPTCIERTFKTRCSVNCQGSIAAEPLLPNLTNHRSGWFDFDPGHSESDRYNVMWPTGGDRMVGVTVHYAWSYNKGSSCSMEDVRTRSVYLEHDTSGYDIPISVTRMGCHLLCTRGYMERVG